MIIDCHGHYTTAPKGLQAFRDAQIAELKNPPARARRRAPSTITRRRDPREPRGRAAEAAARARDRRHDLLAARVGDGAPHRRRDDEPALDRALQRSDLPRLRAVSGELRRRLPAAADAGAIRWPTASRELERCVNELGFIGCNLNPDPSGGYWTAPPLTDKYWYPFYEKMVELDVPAMVHVSASCNPNFHATGAHYINADTTAFMQFLTADLFKDFPALRLIIPHGGGARAVPLGPLPRPGAGHEAAAARRPDPQQRVLRHLRLPPGRASTCC